MASVGGAKRPGGGDPDLQPGVSKKARHKYVVDEAEESDGGGGNAASGGEEDGASVDSYEDDGFVDKTDGAAEVGGARNAGAESDGSEGSDDRESSSDDSDDSDSDSDGGDEAGSGAEAGKRGKKRRLRAKRETVLDDEDLALVKENAAGEFLTSEDGPRLPGDEDILKSFEAAEAPLGHAAGGGFEEEEEFDSEGMDDFIEREGPRVPRAARKRVQAVASTVSAEEMTDFESIFGAFATSMLASQQEMDEPDPELAVQVLSEVYGDELFEETVPGDGAPDAAQSKQLSKLMAAAFEPDEVGRLFVSDVDRAMREADIPERLFSLRGSRAQLLGEEGEAALAADTALAMQESAWIATRLLVELHESGYDVSRDSVCGNQYFASYAADPRYGEPVVGPDGGPTTSDPAVLAALTDGVSAILSLVLSANLEVCTVWAHRRESFPPVLRLHHLWRVLDQDEEW
ncbi:unnamed protein product, partial [Symbiodinium sp. KB8]